MANIASQRKRIGRTARETAENRRMTGAVRTYLRRLQRAAEDGDQAAIETEHAALASRIDKAVQRGAMHVNKGARKKRRAAQIARGGRG